MAKTTIKVYEYLPTSKENAVTRDVLATRIGCNPRQITIAIRLERLDGKPIGSTSQGGSMGYWIMTKEEERQEVVRSLKHRIREQEKTLRALEAMEIQEVDILPDKE